MEVTVKLRLLFTSALFLFVQIATMHAQERVDVAWLAPQETLTLIINQKAVARLPVGAWPRQ
jgi:hypothetical protein